MTRRHAAVRVPACPWKTVPESEVTEAYRRIADRLTDRACPVGPVSGPHAARALTYLYHLLALLARPATPRHPAAAATWYDPRSLASTTDHDAVAAAWLSMPQTGRWSAKHTALVRKLLSRALWCAEAPTLAAIVEPALGARVSYVTERSHQMEFRLHDALPLRLRRLGPRHLGYQLLHRIVDEAAAQLRSVSHGNLQRMARWLDRLVLTDTHLEATTLDDAWRGLQAWDARRWLARYGEVTATHSVGFTLFRRHMHWIRIVHAQVLHAGDRAVVSVPLPRVAGRLVHQVPEDDDDGGGGTSSTEAEEDATGGKVLRDELFALQRRVCRPRTASMLIEESTRRFAFTVAEVRAVVGSARTPCERLMVLLFLTTALRLGGMARLRLVPGGGSSAAVSRLSTIEKGGQVRTIAVTASVRPWLSLWLETRDASYDSPYVFPSPRDPSQPVSKGLLWRWCRTLFQRAGLDGQPHAHPTPSATR